MIKRAFLFLSAMVLVVCADAQNVPGALSSGKLAPKPLYRDPVFDGVADPCFCFNAEQKKWLMYYTQRRATVANLGEIEWVHGTEIGIAESSDGGATWKYAGTAAIEHGKDQGSKGYTYWNPDVIWNKGLYHMFLTYVPGVFNDWGHPREIVHLTSKDGMRWDVALERLDLKSDCVLQACVRQVPGGIWRMWYRDEANGRTVCYADSRDLYKWEPKGRATGDVADGGPKVFYWKGRYWLVAYGDGGVLRVWVSESGQEWYQQEGPLCGLNGDVVVSDNRAWWFYVSSTGERTSSVNVSELFSVDDQSLGTDPEKPTYIDLKPFRQSENRQFKFGKH